MKFFVESRYLNMSHIAKSKQNPLYLVPDFNIPNPPQWPTGSGLDVPLSWAAVLTYVCLQGATKWKRLASVQQGRRWI